MIRKITGHDLPAIEDLLQVGLREQEVHAAACVPPEDHGFYEEEIAEHRAGLRSEPASWWVATQQDGTVVGCLWLQSLIDPLGPYRSVREIIVRPELRGEGFGTRLLATSEAAARESEAVMMLISAFRSNPALRLYRRVGFTDFPAEFKEDTNSNHVVLWKDLRNVAGAA